MTGSSNAARMPGGAWLVGAALVLTLLTPLLDPLVTLGLVAVLLVAALVDWEIVRLALRRAR